MAYGLSLYIPIYVLAGVPAPPFSKQVHANMPGKAAEDITTWHGWMAGTPGSCIWPGLALNAAAIWGVNSSMEGGCLPLLSPLFYFPLSLFSVSLLLFLSLPLYFSAFQINK